MPEAPPAPKAFHCPRPHLATARSSPAGDADTGTAVITVVLSREPNASFGIDVDQANTVQGTDKGSPAAQAGLQPGDVITKVDGKPLQGSIIALMGSVGYQNKSSLVLTVARTRAYKAQTSTR